MAAFLGIDYGSKRIGVALSDRDGKIAFPKVVLENNITLVDKVIKIVEEENVDAIVIGESKDYKGKDNIIMADIKLFVEKLKKKTNTTIYLEPEFMTSAQVESIGGGGNTIDSSAAALILQSYLDKKNKKSILDQ